MMPQDNDAQNPDAQNPDAQTPDERSADRQETLDWDELFASQPGSASSASLPSSDSAPAPATRRERRGRGSAQPTVSDAGAKGTMPRKRSSKKWVAWLVALVVVVGLGAGAVGFVWLNFEDQIRKVMGWEIPPADYEGEGTGEATLVIRPGDTGADVTQSLLDGNIIASYEAFWEILLKEDPQFHPGYYQLAEQMSARSALDAILDPANKLENTALIREGLSVPQLLDELSVATGIPLEEFESAIADHTVYGVPAEAPSIEGYLFPARYIFDPGMDAPGIITTLVNRTFQSLDAAGVPVEDRHRVLTIASLIQREAGSNEEDFYKVSRVIQNRLDEGMLLQFDSTSHYGYTFTYGDREQGGVFSTEAELKDPNPFNTYVHTGLPPGPISASGDTAIKAAMQPAEGPWKYFVAVNLDTGETEFNETLSGHNTSVAKMQSWCASTKSPNCG